MSFKFKLGWVILCWRGHGLDLGVMYPTHYSGIRSKWCVDPWPLASLQFEFDLKYNRVVTSRHKATFTPRGSFHNKKFLNKILGLHNYLTWVYRKFICLPPALLYDCIRSRLKCNIPIQLSFNIWISTFCMNKYYSLILLHSYLFR